MCNADNNKRAQRTTDDRQCITNTRRRNRTRKEAETSPRFYDGAAAATATATAACALCVLYDNGPQRRRRASGVRTHTCTYLRWPKTFEFAAPRCFPLARTHCTTRSDTLDPIIHEYTLTHIHTSARAHCFRHHCLLLLLMAIS